MSSAVFQAGSKRAALIIAHPGHELRVHHWLEEAKPLVFVLTDGSGRTAQSRLGSTSKILDRAGAAPGSVCGRFTDAAIYPAMLAGERGIFLSLLNELAGALMAARIDYVAGDALHDLCRHLIGAAVELAQRRSGREIGNYDFRLTGRPDAFLAGRRAGAISLSLDDAAVERKLTAAQDYPELFQEVNSALRQIGKSAFSVEWLAPVSNATGLHPGACVTPYYETYGEQQKAAGHYQQVIRLREHVLPLACALWDHIEQEAPLAGHAHSHHQ